MATPRRSKPVIDSTKSPAEQLAQAYRMTFSTDAGQLVLDDLDKRFGRRRSFVSGDAYATSFNEGQRDVVLLILALMDKDQKGESL